MSGIWDPLNPELDSSPPRRPPPSTAYFVCATPRCGSGLVCRGLARTGIAGAPAEYFNATFRDPLARRWRAGGDLEAYVRALRSRRTDANGVFGAKLQWEHVERLGGLDVIERWFPGAKYVAIERNDVNRQAVSWWVAMHTDVWAIPVDGPPPPRVPYSFAGICRLRQTILAARQSWRSAFARTGAEPVRVSYEELAADFRPTIAGVLEEVTGRRIDPNVVPPPDSRKQANDHSEELVRRFAEDVAAGRRPKPLAGLAQTAVARRLWRFARAAR